MLSEVDHLHQSSNFKKGMTLDEYLSQMQTLKQDDAIEQKAEQDLYFTSKRNQPTQSRKIITYEIRQSEEDDYQQSHQEKTLEDLRNRQTIKFRQNQHRMSNKNILMSFPGVEMKTSLENNKSFRVRKQSNSPYNQHKKDVASSSPNKNFAMTLFHGDWKNQIDSTVRSSNPSTTLYGKFLKGVKQTQNHKARHIPSKQKYFQKKNGQQIQYVLKYEKQIQDKYNKCNHPQIFDMRVQGITDRLHDRKALSLKVHK